MDHYLIGFLQDKDNKQSIDYMLEQQGILRLRFSKNQITNRLIIGFDSYISLRKNADIKFGEFFKKYKIYLNTISTSSALGLKILLYEISKKVDLIPQLAMFDLMRNTDIPVGYNIHYQNKKISENIYVDIRSKMNLKLEVLSQKRDGKSEEKIKREILDIEKTLSNGLFNLIIYDDYPEYLEPILPRQDYEKQIRERILKDKVEVKHQGKIYKAIELKNSYIALDADLKAVRDQKKAKSIYCKASLRKSFLF